MATVTLQPKCGVSLEPPPPPPRWRSCPDRGASPPVLTVVLFYYLTCLQITRSRRLTILLPILGASCLHLCAAVEYDGVVVDISIGLINISFNWKK